MKLKLYLCFVGAVFNFFLIMLRFYLHKVRPLLPVTAPRDLVEPSTGGQNADHIIPETHRFT